MQKGNSCGQTDSVGVRKRKKNLMQVDESSKNSNEHIVVDTVVHLDRYKAMNMRVNFIFYTCFTW